MEKKNHAFSSYFPSLQIHTTCKAKSLRKTCDIPGKKAFFWLFIVNHFPNKPLFLLVCSTSLLKTLWKEEKLLVTSNFTLFHSVFCPFRELSAIFNKLEIVVCKLFQFGRV